MIFSAESIIRLFEERWDNQAESDLRSLVKEKGGISSFECALMYMYIRAHRPRHLIEFSPNHGYSTEALARGQRAMRNRWSFGSFEIEDSFVKATRTRICKAGLDEFVDVIWGDALVEIPKYARRFGTESFDFCFIDSDHTNEFAQRYIKEIFPLLRPGCLIGVHDICSKQHNNQGYTNFNTSLQSGVYKSGEEQPIKKFIIDRQCDFCVLHAITGGTHEGAKLAWNVHLFNALQKITGIDFRSKICPKTLFLRLPGGENAVSSEASSAIKALSC